MEINNSIKDAESNSEISNVIKLDNGIYTHKQIEKRNGLVFMRMKSRRIAG